MKISKINRIIDKEIERLPGVYSDEYIRGMKRAKELINLADIASPATQQAMIGKVISSCDCDMNIKLQERCEDPPFKSLVWDEKNWLYLPDSICYISVKDIKSIAFGTGVKDNTQILFADVYWDLLHSTRYYGRDVQTLEEFVKQGEIDLREKVWNVKHVKDDYPAMLFDELRGEIEVERERYAKPSSHVATAERKEGYFQALDWVKTVIDFMDEREKK